MPLRASLKAGQVFRVYLVCWHVLCQWSPVGQIVVSTLCCANGNWPPRQSSVCLLDPKPTFRGRLKWWLLAVVDLSWDVGISHVPLVLHSQTPDLIRSDRRLIWCSDPGGSPTYRVTFTLWTQTLQPSAEISTVSMRTHNLLSFLEVMGTHTFRTPETFIYPWVFGSPKVVGLVMVQYCHDWVISFNESYQSTSIARKIEWFFQKMSTQSGGTSHDLQVASNQSFSSNLGLFLVPLPNDGGY